MFRLRPARGAGAIYPWRAFATPFIAGGLARAHSPRVLIDTLSILTVGASAGLRTPYLPLRLPACQASAVEASGREAAWLGASLKPRPHAHHMPGRWQQERVSSVAAEAALPRAIPAGLSAGSVWLVVTPRARAVFAWFHILLRLGLRRLAPTRSAALRRWRCWTPGARG